MKTIGIMPVVKGSIARVLIKLVVVPSMCNGKIRSTVKVIHDDLNRKRLLFLFS